MEQEYVRYSIVAQVGILSITTYESYFLFALTSKNTETLSSIAPFSPTL